MEILERIFVCIAVFLVFLIMVNLLAIAIAVPTAHFELDTFNEMNDTNYTLWQWIWCADAIKLQHATEKVEK